MNEPQTNGPQPNPFGHRYDLKMRSADGYALCDFCGRIETQRSLGHCPGTGAVGGFVAFIESRRWHSFPVSLKEFKTLAWDYLARTDVSGGAAQP